MKKMVNNLIKIILIILPIIVFCIDFCATFWGVEYELNVNQTNIMLIEESLQKDNIKIDNLNNVIKIEIRGAGLNDYSVLMFYYNDNSIKSIDLYLNKQSYYIEQYLSKHHKFNYNDMFYISGGISLLTIGFSLYTYKKNKKQIK